MLLDPGQVQAALFARTASAEALREGASPPLLGEPVRRRAAVAIIFRTGENQSELLVIERATHPGDPWSGHLAFPGGRSDPNDRDAVRTAVRETREELGLDLDRHGTLLGALEPISTAGTGLPELTIAPFVFALADQPELRADPAEVASVFWVPLGPLLRGERDTILQITRQRTRHRMPGFDVEGRVLWGLSYRMLQSLFALLHEH